MRILGVFSTAKHSICLTNPKLFKYFCHADHFIKKKKILICFSNLPCFPDLFVQLISCNIRWGIHQGWTNQSVLRMGPPDALNCSLGMPLSLLVGKSACWSRAQSRQGSRLHAAFPCCSPCPGGAGVPREWNYAYNWRSYVSKLTYDLLSL